MGIPIYWMTGSILEAGSYLYWLLVEVTYSLYHTKAKRVPSGEILLTSIVFSILAQ